MTPRPKIELLAPAGNYEKLEIAIHYGADAVYLGGKAFSLRQFSENFDATDLKRAIDLAHGFGVNVYVACNIFPRNSQLNEITGFLKYLEQIGPDGVIIADPGILALARKSAPRLRLHLSTQTNTTNLAAARFWQEHGVKRINVARELTLEDIRALAEETDLEIEAFVHGAMCIAYSGRCLLSNFMAGREAIDAFYDNPEEYTVRQEWRDLLADVGQRGYCTGFYFGDPNETSPNPNPGGMGEPPRLVGKVDGTRDDGLAIVDVRNTFNTGDRVEVLSPGLPVRTERIAGVWDTDGIAISQARSGSRVMVKLPTPCARQDLIRKLRSP